jgi:hypothetical protein
VNSPIADASPEFRTVTEGIVRCTERGRAHIDTLKELKENTDGHAVVDSKPESRLPSHRR